MLRNCPWMGKVAGAVNDVIVDLLGLEQEYSGDLEKGIKYTKKALEKFRRRGVTRDNVAKLEILKYKLEMLQKQRELYWH